MKYIIETESKTVFKPLYFDGHGFSLLPENAKVFEDTHEHAKSHAQMLSAAFVQTCLATPITR